MGGIYFTEMWGSEALEHGLEIGKYQPMFVVGIFEYMSWVNHSFFKGDEWGFMEEVVKTFLITPWLPLESPTFSIVASIVYA